MANIIFQSTAALKAKLVGLFRSIEKAKTTGNKDLKKASSLDTTATMIKGELDKRSVRTSMEFIFENSAVLNHVRIMLVKYQPKNFYDLVEMIANGEVTVKDILAWEDAHNVDKKKGIPVEPRHIYRLVADSLNLEKLSEASDPV